MTDVLTSVEVQHRWAAPPCLPRRAWYQWAALNRCFGGIDDVATGVCCKV